MQESPKPPVLNHWAHDLSNRSKDLSTDQWAYKLHGDSYGIDIAIGNIDVDEKHMSLRFPFASGVARDGVGDLLEIGGIRTDRHRKNPICLWNHGKECVLPLGITEDPKTKQYTVELDQNDKTAWLTCFFYQGKGMPGVDTKDDYDHAVFCAQIFDLAAKRYIRAGSIGYQVVKALKLPADYERGTPPGLHLLVTLMLEGSLVVLPANGDTVRKALALPNVCGKAMSPVLVKSLTPYAEPAKAIMFGIGSGSTSKLQWRELGSSILESESGGHKFSISKANRSATLYHNGASEGRCGTLEECQGWAEEIVAGKRKNLEETKALPPDPNEDLPYGGRYGVWKKGDKFDDFGKIWEVIKLRDNGRVLLCQSNDSKDRFGKVVPETREFPLTSMGNVHRKNVDSISPEKARQILKDGEVHGKPLTDKQRGMFGAAANKNIKSIRMKYRRKMGGNMQTKVAKQSTAKSLRQHYRSKRLGAKELTGKKSFDKDTARVAHSAITQMGYGIGRPKIVGNDLVYNTADPEDAAMIAGDIPAKLASWGVRGTARPQGRDIYVTLEQKSLSVNYRNKLVKGVAEVQMKFATDHMPHAKQVEFYKEMEAAGYGKPGGRWSDDGKDLQSPLKKACFKFHLDPDQDLTKSLANATSIASKHGAKFLGSGQVTNTVGAKSLAAYESKGVKCSVGEYRSIISGLSDAFSSLRSVATAEEWEREAERVKKWARELMNTECSRASPDDKLHAERLVDQTAVYIGERRGIPGPRRDRTIKSIHTLKGNSSMRTKADPSMNGATDPTQEVPTDLDEQVGEERTEPIGAQALRRIHEHHLMLMEDYHEMLDLMEPDSKVKVFTEELLEGIEQMLEAVETLMGEQYPDLEPLEGVGDKDMDGVEMPGEEDEIPVEEAVEGMKEKRFGSKYLKKGQTSDAYGVYCQKCGWKGGPTDADATNGRCPKCKNPVSTDWSSKVKGMCPGCDSEPCECGKGEKGGSDKLRGRNQAGQIRAIWHEDPEGDYHPDAKFITSKWLAKTIGKALGKDLTEEEAGAVVEKLEGEMNDTEAKSFLHPKHKDMVSGAAGFLGEAGNHNGEWGDEHRMKAMGWHKALGEMTADDEMPAEEASLDPSVDPTEETEGVPGEMGQKGWNIGDKVVVDKSGKYRGQEGVITEFDRKPIGSNVENVSQRPAPSLFVKMPDGNIIQVDIADTYKKSLPSQATKALASTFEAQGKAITDIAKTLAQLGVGK